MKYLNNKITKGLEIIMKKIVTIALCLIFIISLVSCKGGDVLKGTWTCEDKDYGAVKWEFDGSGKCSMKNDFFDSEGTYSIGDDNTVTIKLESWDDEKVYAYTVSDNALALTATDGLSPDYELTRK